MWQLWASMHMWTQLRWLWLVVLTRQGFPSNHPWMSSLVPQIHHRPMSTGLVEPIDRMYPPTVEAAAANPTPKEGVFLQHRRDVTEVPLGGSILERTPMSEAEAEAIMLGGAEP